MVGTKRLGMLIPSSNTVVEPETNRLIPPDEPISLHISRLKVVQLTADDGSLRQFELDRILAAADLLADAKVDLILWNGTAASWLGFERDAVMTKAIEEATGIRATTAIIALNDKLKEIGARRIGLVTPYVEALERRIIDNYEAAGFKVAAAVRANLTVNTDYAAISPAKIADMAREVARTPVDAIIILCTNLAGASIAAPLSAELGVPVLDSVVVAFEHSLDLIAIAGGKEVPQ